MMQGHVRLEHEVERLRGRKLELADVVEIVLALLVART